MNRCYCFVTIVSMAMMLTSCAVGPDYRKPDAPTSDRYTPTPVLMPSISAPEAAQQFSSGTKIGTQWWKLFQSDELDKVVDLAIQGNPTVESARATLAQARESLTAARGVYYPQVNVDATVSRSGQQLSGIDLTGNFFSIGPSVSYPLDIFGGNRRRVEQQIALTEYQRYQYEAAYLTLTGSAVIQAINIASATEQLKAVEEILAVDQRNLELVRISAQAGKSAQLEVLSAESQLASDRTILPSLHQQMDVAQHALTILMGKFPSEGLARNFDFSVLSLPHDLPLSLPSELVHARPDIASSEAQLHAASAAVGVATAQLYPSVTITGAWVYEANDINSVFNPSNSIWNAAANLTAPLFHGRALQAQRRAAADAYQAQLANYRQTVLQAFGQVADLLRALGHDAESLDAELKALETARASLDLTQESYQAGQSSFLQLLEAQRLYQQARLGYVRAKSQRYADSAQLFVALGGGWDATSTESR
jgi:NodT family efflux transporter outer membrane factor (OMF) lipoprotein